VLGVAEELLGKPATEPQELLADSKLIQAELGWRPRRSDIREIIADAWAAPTGK
jgi:UDP-glucose 4-epimerase